MKLQTVWTRLVVVLYMVAVVGLCLYVPSYIVVTGTNGDITASGPVHYRWVWNLEGELNISGNTVKMLVDYGPVCLRVGFLTVIAGIVFINGPLAEWKEKKAQQPDFRGHVCLEQIWLRPLQEGERELSLLALCQGLMMAGHSDGYAWDWVERKNGTLDVPFNVQELSQMMQSPEAELVGDSYGVGCRLTRENLPWVDCRGCRYANKEAR